MATLYGPDGMPIDLTKLKGEQAAPTLTGVRTILANHPSRGLTPQRLARLLSEAESGDATRYLELAEEMEEKDLHYLAVMGTRRRAISQLDITLEPASDKPEDVRNCELVQSFLDRQEIEDELNDVLDAIGKGFSVTEIVWETSERQWMPRRLEWRFPQWFEFDRTDGRTLRLRVDAGVEDLAPYKFVVHFHKAKAGLPIRGGLARAAAWGYLFKNYDIKDWLAFIEVYGQPIRVGKYPAAATPDDKRTLLEAVANIGSDAAAIIPTSMVIEFVKAEQRGSSELYRDFANYIDQQVSKAVLGQTTTTDAISGGHAVSKEHNEVRRDIERADAKQLAATLNVSLVRPIVDLNRGPQKAYPQIRIGRAERTDVKELSEALSRLVPLGFRVRQSEIRNKLDLAEPEDGDELLAPAAKAPAPGEPGPGVTPEERTAAARAALRQDRGEEDAIERAIAEAIDAEGWEPAMTPIVQPLLDLAAKATSIEEFRDRLAELLPAMGTGSAEDLLARLLFAARLAGETEAPIADAE